MKVVSAPEGSEQVMALLEPLESEPVMVQFKGKDVGVFLSPHAYERMQKAEHADFWALSEHIAVRAQSRGLTEEKLADILQEIDQEMSAEIRL